MNSVLSITFCEFLIICDMTNQLTVSDPAVPKNESVLLSAETMFGGDG